MQKIFTIKFCFYLDETSRALISKDSQEETTSCFYKKKKKKLEAVHTVSKSVYSVSYMDGEQRVILFTVSKNTVYSELLLN